MNNSNLVYEGVQLMFVGMGMVFVFLSVLVFCTSLMQKIFKEENTLVVQTNPSGGSSITEEEVAVISAAVHAFRNNKSE